MELFKKSKKQPIKLRGFDYIGFHTDYENCCYYKKDLPRDNFEIMETMLEGKSLRKAELGAGTKIQIIDAFMSNYLYNVANNIEYATRKDFLKNVVETTYADLEPTQKEGIIEKFDSKLPKEIEKSDSFKKAIKNGFRILYCSNDESDTRSFGIVNIVMVKDEHLKSNNKMIDIDRHYTIFQPLRFMVKPSYLLNKSGSKYHEEELPLIVINNELLNK